MKKVKIGLMAIIMLSVGQSFSYAAQTSLGWAAPLTTTTLKDAIMFAFQRDPSVGQQAAQVGIGQAQIDQARSAWMPQLSLSGSAGHSQTTDSSGSLSNSTTWGMSLTQLVYDFGKTNNAIDQSEAQRNSYRYQLMATLSSVAEKTALDYVEVQRYSALVQAAQQNIVALQSVSRMAQLRAQAGLSSTSDELQTRTRVAGMQATLQQYQATLMSARARLAVLTGMNASDYAPIPATLAIKDTSLNDIDYSLIPSVLAAKEMESSAQYGIQKVRAQYWPTISVRGGRTRYQSSNRSYWDNQIQLNVDAPIYQGGAVSAQVKQAQGAKEVAATQVDQARFDVLQKASVALADWLGAQARIDVNKQQVLNADQTREVYKNEYTLNKRSINDLLSVEQDVWQAISSQINSQYDAWTAAINYATSLDNLLPLLGIEKNTRATLPDLN
ncbi:TolC family outer membrane protein [Tatumella sp. OPLPL6]|uniref:TolC family outer membrane protein n=1 Tax=Tatumella sp. OPLPL6 TaxID=1928657 RepID=UPI000C18C076|nr:TolC family outer membrane protein [Tatumella sp. OPLPL6]PIJ45788.1 type I secretion system outer membrane protein [Tatumella sp. OPLPL6]